MNNSFMGLQVFLKFLHIVSHQCRSGMFLRPTSELVMDGEFVYHVGFGLICCAGLMINHFFYSILVCVHVFTVNSHN